MFFLVKKQKRKSSSLCRSGSEPTSATAMCQTTSASRFPINSLSAMRWTTTSTSGTLLLCLFNFYRSLLFKKSSELFTALDILVDFLYTQKYAKKLTFLFMFYLFSLHLNLLSVRIVSHNLVSRDLMHICVISEHGIQKYAQN